MKITDLGLSPLSLVLASEDGSEGRASELEERIAHRVASTIVGANGRRRAFDFSTLRRLARRSGRSASARCARCSVGLRTLITEQRALDARDFALPQDLRESGVDATEIGNRSNALVNAVRTANNELTTLANAATTPSGERRSETRCSALRILGIRNALPERPARELPALRPMLFDQAKSVSKGVAASLARVDAEDADFATRVASPTPPDADARAQHFITRVRLLLGNAFPMLPKFSAINASEVAASLAQRDSMNGGDQFAAHGWLARIALVRPAVESLGKSAVGGGGRGRRDRRSLARAAAVRAERSVARASASADAVGG